MPEVMLEVVPLRIRYVAFFKQVKRQERENRKKPPSLPSAVEDEEDNEEEEEGGSDDEAEVAAKKAKPNEVAAGDLVSGMGYASAGAAEGFDLSLDSLDSDSEPVKSEEDFAREDAAAAEKEFRKVFPDWFGLVVDWKAEFPEAKLEGVDLLNDLFDIDMGATCTAMLIPPRKHAADPLARWSIFFLVR